MAVGQNGPAQTVTSSNTGNGSLSLSAAANVTWLTPSVTASGAINIGLNTAALTRGNYTGVVTVSAPNAVDAPQMITVTVQVGSAVPDSLDLYLPPGGSASAAFTTGSSLTVAVNNPVGGPTLAVSTSGGGSFAFSFPYQVTARAPAATIANNYAGSFTVSGSSFAADNKTVPVTAHVTTPADCHVVADERAVQHRAGSRALQTQGIQVLQFRRGDTGHFRRDVGIASWLTTSIQGNAFVFLTADPTGIESRNVSGHAHGCQ